MATQKSKQQVVSAWLNYSIDYLRELFDEYGVSRDRDLLFNTLAGEVQGSGDNVTGALLRYNFYLRYLDMGVGRGVPAGSQVALKDAFFESRNKRGQLHQYRRKPKPLYNKPMTYQTKRLLEILMEEFKIGTIQVIDDALKKNNSLDINL